MPHRGSPPLLGLVVGGLGLAEALVEDLGVLVLQHYSAHAHHLGYIDHLRQHPWRLLRDDASAQLGVACAGDAGE